MEGEQDIIVLGGGITALSFGYFLRKYNPDCKFKILIDQPKSGGMILSEKYNDVVVEWGPRGIRPKGKGQQVLELVEELNLWDEIVFADSKAKKRYLLLNGKLQVIPYSLTSFLKSPFLKLFWKAFLKDLSSKKKQTTDESIASFMDRHFGYEFRTTFIDSMISGIWAGDVEKMSVSACFSILKKAENIKGSVLRGLFACKKTRFDYKIYEKSITEKALFSFKEGIQVLVSRLTEELKDYILYNQKVLSIEATGQVSIQTNQEKFLCNKCVSTLPAHVMADLTHKPLSDLLKSIVYAPLALVNMVIPKNEVSFDGFGFLVPSKEKMPILGMVANSNVFSDHCPEKQMLCTFIMGGARTKFDDLKGIEHEQNALNIAQNVLNLKSNPIFIKSKMIKNGIPQYHVGHLELVSSIEKQCPKNIKLLGNYLHGVSIVDIICKSKQTAQDISI